MFFLHAYSDMLIRLLRACQIPTIIFSVSHEIKSLICQIYIIAPEA